MLDHKNRNGLVNGKIPAGRGCPFLEGCAQRNSGCPTEQGPHALAFACTSAVLHSMEAVGKVTTNLRKTTPLVPIIPQRIIVIKSPSLDEAWETP